MMLNCPSQHIHNLSRSISFKYEKLYTVSWNRQYSNQKISIKESRITSSNIHKYVFTNMVSAFHIHPLYTVSQVS